MLVGELAGGEARGGDLVGGANEGETALDVCVGVAGIGGEGIASFRAAGAEACERDRTRRSTRSMLAGIVVVTSVQMVEAMLANREMPRNAEWRSK